MSYEFAGWKRNEDGEWRRTNVETDNWWDLLDLCQQMAELLHRCEQSVAFLASVQIPHVPPEKHELLCDVRDMLSSLRSEPEPVDDDEPFAYTSRADGGTAITDFLKLLERHRRLEDEVRQLQKERK
jgi:hypothetical protein